MTKVLTTGRVSFLATFVAVSAVLSPNLTATIIIDDVGAGDPTSTFLAFAGETYNDGTVGNGGQAGSIIAARHHFLNGAPLRFERNPPGYVFPAFQQNPFWNTFPTATQSRLLRDDQGNLMPTCEPRGDRWDRIWNDNLGC